MKHEVPCEEVEHSNSVFLTDGHRTVNYLDLSAVMVSAGQRLPYLPEVNRTLAIDTTDRLNASLWMTYCWITSIPFVPYNETYTDPLSRFHPGGVISSGSGFDISSTTREKNTKPLATEFKSALHNKPDGVFCGLLTSGSSSKPKKVPLLRSNMVAAAKNAFTTPPPPGSLWGNCLPLHHTGGIAIIFRALLSGTGVFIWNSFTPEKITGDISQNPQITTISLVPTMLKRLAEHNEKSMGKEMPGKLKKILIGGGPAEPELLRKTREIGWPVCFSYGMTETCGQIAAQNISDPEPAGSAGKVFQDHAIRFQSEERQTTGRKPRSGEILVKGPQVFPGYLAEKSLLPDAPLQRSDPWFRTGDYGRMKSDGSLFIENRRTDLIITGGENVSPAEVEKILRNSNIISDAGVTGIEDQEWGQRVVALIVPSKEEPDIADEVMERIAKELKPHQKPSQIIPVSSIPRSVMGKINRPALKALAMKLLAQNQSTVR